jgi:hypothetical protein
MPSNHAHIIIGYQSFNHFFRRRKMFVLLNVILIFFATMASGMIGDDNLTVTEDNSISELRKYLLEGNIKEIGKHRQKLDQIANAIELLKSAGYAPIATALSSTFDWYLRRPFLEAKVNKINFFKDMIFEGARYGSLAKVEIGLAYADKKGVDGTALINAEMKTAAQVAQDRGYRLLAEHIKNFYKPRQIKKPKKLSSKELIEEKIRKYSPKIIRKKSSRSPSPAKDGQEDDSSPKILKRIATNKVRRRSSLADGLSKKTQRLSRKISRPGLNTFYEENEPEKEISSANTLLKEYDPTSNHGKLKHRSYKKPSCSPKKREPSTEESSEKKYVFSREGIENEALKINCKLVIRAYRSEDYSDINDDTLSYDVFQNLKRYSDFFDDTMLKYVMDHSYEWNRRLWSLLDKKKLFKRISELEKELTKKVSVKTKKTDTKPLLESDAVHDTVHANAKRFPTLAFAQGDKKYRFIFDDHRLGVEVLREANGMITNVSH